LSSNAKLSGLTISSGVLSPVFNADSLNYSTSVSSSTSTITITPTSAESNASIKVNGTTVSSGASSSGISLSLGLNTITTAVTAEDGTTVLTYTLRITRIAPVISTSGTLTSLSTTYGAASSSISFNVSGAGMFSGILVNPPSGFEVSLDNSSFTNSLILGASGTIPSTPIYIRLNSTNSGGNYSGNIILSSLSADTVYIATVLSAVNTKTITVTAQVKTKVYGDVDPALTYTFAPTLIGTDAFTGSLSRIVGENIGKYSINQGTLALNSNYTIA
jgi:hypothetical protein